METSQASTPSSPPSSISVIEGALEAFAAEGYSELPVLAFVPMVNLSDLEEDERHRSLGLLHQMKAFVSSLFHRSSTGD